MKKIFEKIKKFFWEEEWEEEEWEEEENYHHDYRDIVELNLIDPGVINLL